MNSVANNDFVVELGLFLAKTIPEIANDSKSYKVWTEAVYASLKSFGDQYSWTISPSEKVFAGEYLCDFTLHEKHYGCRLACESQWQHWKGFHQETLDWAFDKLRGVKSDIKLFIFEGTAEEWQRVISTYLDDYAQLSEREAYLSLRWQKDRFVTSWWKPQQDGKQSAPIQFQVFAGFGAPQETVLDSNENIAALRCTACGKAFVFSKLQNGQKGRECPHCHRSIATIDGDTYKVQLLNNVVNQ